MICSWVTLVIIIIYIIMVFFIFIAIFIFIIIIVMTINTFSEQVSSFPKYEFQFNSIQCLAIQNLKKVVAKTPATDVPFPLLQVIRQKFSVRNFWKDCIKYDCNVREVPIKITIPLQLIILAIRILLLIIIMMTRAPSTLARSAGTYSPCLSLQRTRVTRCRGSKTTTTITTTTTTVTTTKIKTGSGGLFLFCFDISLNPR